ncbi:MAG: membrane protein insertase YidC, partial [Gammaproteobacteria bacterium]
MESIRFILIVSFAMVTMKLWMTWEETYNPQVTTESVAAEQTASDSDGSNEVPVVMDEPTTQETAQLQEIPGETRETESYVEVNTDTFRIKINPVGAGIHHAALRKFPTSIASPEDPFVLMDERPGEIYITQSGLLSRQTAPTHEAVYQSAATSYSLEPGEDTLTVPFEWSGNGITVNKIYEFERGSHVVEVRYRISNRSQEVWNGRSYTQFKRTDPSDGGMRLLYTYTGAVISSEENRYEKIAFDDIDDAALERNVANGWIAMIQHYFLTALVPVDKQATYSYYTRSFGNNLYAAGAITPAIEILPGEQNEIVEQLYIGPKDQGRLAELADGLDLTVDYGKLWFLAKPLFWILGELHELTGNWGWSIILVTVLLKILFYKLSAAGYRSMANMRRVQPRLVSLKERYKDDRAKMNQAMMQIYKEEKINPLGGCFPILIQIPVFIALYWVLLESVELRQAEFIFWLQDLSTPDPYWVLPVIMGITMFVQQKLNPAPIDPIQAKVMMVLPFVFTVFFGFFPSGLVLYWVANNT